MSPPTSTFSSYGWLVCIWVLVVSFQYGYHISALNQIQATLTCRAAPPLHTLALPTCIPMSDAVFSLVTSIFTVGGFFGSSIAGMVMERHGRKAALQFSGLSVAVGSGLMAIAPSTVLLLLGRFLVGCGAGIGLCTGPVFLAEIAPSNIRGSVGVLTQLAIVLGIMITQMLGLRMATPTLWRFVLSFSSATSVVQLCLSRFIVETPVWLKQHGKLEESRLVQKFLFRESESSNSVEDPLLDETPQGSQHDLDDHRGPTSPSLRDLLMNIELRRPLVVVSSAMVSQQVSGKNINSSEVLYYSNDIFSRVLPDAGPYVSIGITLVNTLMTFPPIFLIDRVGRGPLLLASVIGALASLVLTGYALNTGMMIVSSTTILIFVMQVFFRGPVPFIIISEVAPPRAASALSSVALSLNWIANFFVGLAFLPLRNKLSGGDSSKEGRVFYVFAGLLFLVSSIFFRSYRPRT
ncbi:general substrate transporter [Russula aff. rugulosa BPL654]|nr:general substrate transporter [Russula aff. rugulosa BPL654]